MLQIGDWRLLNAYLRLFPICCAKPFPAPQGQTFRETSYTPNRAGIGIDPIPTGWRPWLHSYAATAANGIDLPPHSTVPVKRRGQLSRDLGRVPSFNLMTLHHKQKLAVLKD